MEIGIKRGREGGGVPGSSPDSAGSRGREQAAEAAVEKAAG